LRGEDPSGTKLEYSTSPGGRGKGFLAFVHSALTEAAWLRGEWERKVTYFVYDDTYPFRPEYAIDRTAFESSYALAKYGATHDMAPDMNLPFDRNKKQWYSHPSVTRADSRAFMDRQLRADIAMGQAPARVEMIRR
jgi:hypothetical protein